MAWETEEEKLIKRQRALEDFINNNNVDLTMFDTREQRMDDLRSKYDQFYKDTSTNYANNPSQFHSSFLDQKSNALYNYFYNSGRLNQHQVSRPAIGQSTRSPQTGRSQDYINKVRGSVY
jgi:hypothetical protein